MEGQEKLCRLCLKNCGNNFEVIEKNATKTLVFLLKSDLFINEETVMCGNCAGDIKDCSNFKRICLDVKDSVLKLTNRNDDAKLKGANGDGHKMCRLCMGSLNICLFTSSDNKLEDVALDQMLNKCLPELDLCITEKPIICVPCRLSLQRYAVLITNFSHVEEKIKEYCKAACIEATSLVSLKNVLELTTKNTLAKVDNIKMEDKFCGDEYVEEQKCGNDNMLTNTDTEEVDRIKRGETFPEELNCEIKPKLEDLIKMEDQQSYDVPEFVIKCEADDGYQNDVIEIKQSYCLEGVNEFEQEHLNRLQYGDISPQMDSNFNLPNMEGCSSTQSHRTLPQVMFVKPDKKIKMYHCDHCPFQTKYKGNLKDHLMIHKNPSELTAYQCQHCSFQTKYKSYLKNHLLSHKTLTEVTTYQCNQCSFRTRYKRCLKGHLLVHKEPTETTMHQCQHCSFQTKHKNSLETHLLTHKNSSDITVYRCEECSFHTKFKCNLKGHLLTHKSPLEITMYSCEHCPFQAKRNRDIKAHLLTHKNPSEITMYPCQHCSFQTKRKGDLKKHLLRRHKDHSGGTIHQCELCSYQTKYKGYLKRHLSTHKDPSEIAMYQCKHCSFQTNRNGNLKRHSMIHKNVSDQI